MSDVQKPDAGLAAHLLELEERRRQALITADIAVLDELFDESIVHIHAPGVTHTKAQLLEHVALRHAYLDSTRGELNIRVIGDVAIMTGPLVNRLRTKEGGERTLGGVTTQVLRRDDSGRWRFVSFQMTPTAEQAWPSLPSEKPAGTEQEQQ